MENSHVQIPRLILKNFHNRNKELFYYEFESGKIKRGRAKTLYTQLGYYSNYVEDFLGQRIESPLGSVVKHIINTNFEQNENLPNEYESTIYCYIYSLISRAPSMLKEINQNSVFFQFLDETSQHDIAAHDTLLLSIEKNLLKGYKINFVVNNTTSKFVLPTCGIVELGMDLLCPISPYRAFYLKKGRDYKVDEEDVNVVTVYEIDSVDFIQDINLRAFEQERKGDRKYIVATSREELQELVDTKIN